MTREESEETKIAVINTNIGFIQKDILEIKLALRDQYATRESLIQVAKDTELRLVKLESQNNLWKWLNPIIVSIMSAVITFLVIQYFMSIANKI